MILVINSGSSSLKFRAFEANDALALKASGKIEEIGAGEDSSFKIKIGDQEAKKGKQNFADHKQALEFVLAELESNKLSKMTAVGHRVVHGGDRFLKATLVNDQVIAEIKECIPLAPLHNPANLTGIKAATALFGNLPQVAAFDTAFHNSMPEVAKTYAIPHELTKAGYKRYGFHGISHEFITTKLATMLDQGPEKTSLISCHLGNGASLCAVQNGKSIDTSMGYTPLEGLVMGTRTGDLDAGIIFALLESGTYKVEELNKLLNKKSGLLGLSGLDNDMRTILENQKDTKAALALEVYCYRLAKYIAAYSIMLPKDAPIVFTAGVGENAALVREKTLSHLGNLNYVLDKKLNDDRPKDSLISTKSSAPVYVLSTNEERLIAEKTVALI